MMWVKFSISIMSRFEPRYGRNYMKPIYVTGGFNAADFVE